MRESYGFNIDRTEHGAFPLAAQDGAVDATKHKIKMFADDLRRMLKGDATKHLWQLVDAAGKPTDLKTAIAALDAKPKHRLINDDLPKSKAEQKRNSTAQTWQERQNQSQNDKTALAERLYSGKGSLASKFWPSKRP